MQTNVQYVKGVGPKWAKLLKKLNIETVVDLLYYFPRDYEDRSNIQNIKRVRPGETVTIKGKVVRIEEKKIKKNFPLLRVTFSDDTDVLNGVWFNQPYIKDQFEPEEWYLLSGEVNEKSWWKYNKKEINNPVYEKLKVDEHIHTGRVVPIYALTSGIFQKRLRQVIFNALKKFAGSAKDVLPEYIIEKYNLLNIEDSLWGLHFPRDRKHYIEARKRLAFEELFLFQLKMLIQKQGITRARGIKHDDPGKIMNDFIRSLPFDLTDAQKQVWEDIKNDMEREVPMQRLLQGDVGSGKTVIAALSLIETMASGNQGIFMAPTEILAEQHYLNLKNMLEPFGFRTGLLIGSITGKEREELLEQIASNQLDLVIGTHALFQESIEYYRPGLVVIDEQHRFGVEQRHKLKNKGENPDLLVMTATPIPRSLALTLYGDLDISVIDELPPGRKPVKTRWTVPENRSKVYNFVRKNIQRGRQAYVVCPLIEPSEEVEALAAGELKKKLEKHYLSGCRIDLLHGQRSQDEKNQVMESFRRGEIEVLVATTVIEVGMDVSNAAVMVIEDADRFGLAQLHQLRGRVGRSQNQAYCFLIARPSTEEGKKRLKIMTSTNDGFKIAEEDLKLRGPGEFFGTRQSGMPDLQVASILRDKKLLRTARREADRLLRHPDWSQEYRVLNERIKDMELKV